MDERVRAIRKNKRVGEGSCTGIDECYTNRELQKMLDEEGVTTPEAAVQWAIDLEGLQLENALNQRWGEDDDRQLRQWEEWVAGA